MKKKILKIATVICLLISILFLGQASAFADEPAWTTLASMSEVHIRNSQKFQTEVVNGKIYVVGGMNNSVEVYNSITDTWTTLPSMSTTRMNFQTEVIDGKIYAIGGMRKWGYTDISSSVEVYDPNTNTWTMSASMSTPRYWFQTEVIDGKIYAIGGMDKSSILSTTEVYDPITDTWTTLASMTITRVEHETEVIDGKIYTIGGMNGPKSGNVLSKTEVYDPITDTWIRLNSMSMARDYFGTEVINGKIYAIGGQNSSSLSAVEVYDPNTDVWEALESMSTPRTGLQTEVINGKIYAIGGRALSSMEVYTVTAGSENQLKATGGDSRVDLTWNAVTGATDYIVKRSTTAGGPYVTVAVGITGTAYTDTSVINGTTYYYAVTSIINGSEDWNSNEASAVPYSAGGSNQPTGDKALLIITMVTGERKEYDLSMDKIHDFIAWYNSKASSNPTYVIEKNYNRGSFTSRKDYIVYDQISNFEINEYSGMVP